jgi:anaerobic magnesium-protoporphyrin IX monomethyl ester cyclase
LIDVLLTHSYHLTYDRKQVRKQQPYPPLGTLYAASILRDAGFSVAVFDTMLTDPVGFNESLKKHRPKVVAIYEDDFNFLTKMCLTRMRELAWRMAEEAKTSGARVVVHGSDAADHTDEFLRNGADFVVTGAGEKALLDVVRAIFCGSDPSEVEGVVSSASEEAGGSGKPRISQNAIPTAMPLPARDLIDLRPYRDAWLAAHGKFSLNMVASRGCPFRCNWCAKPIFGDNFYVRSAKDVAGEMQMLKQHHGADHIWFADDIFALNRNWAQQLAAEVERRNCAIPFKVQTRADLMTPETVSALQRAGCAEVWMGVESGSQKILDAMDKGLRVEEVWSARQNLRREGIRACYFLQFGYPSESWSDIKKTIALVRETRPDDIGVSFSYPLPNTRFYERVRHQLGTKRNWSDSDDLCVMFKGAYKDEFYRSIRDALRAEVDVWKATGSRSADEQYVRNLWSEIERSEVTSRNPDATQLALEPVACGGSWPPIPHSSDRFVSIRGALAPAREG